MHRLLRRGLVLVMSGLLASCAVTQYNLPPVTGDTDGRRHPGKFIWHDLISDDPAGSERFYGELFGWEFRPLPLPGADYRVIALHGEPIGGMVAQRELPTSADVSQWVSVMSVADPVAAVRTVRDGGGRVLREPVTLGDRGVIAVFADAQGGLFATLTTREGDPPDAATLPPAGAFLWHELWTPDRGDAARLYARLGELELEERDVQGENGRETSVLVLGDGTRARATIRDLPAAGMPTMWMPYLRVENLTHLEELLARVPPLGGEVLVPATARPIGGHLAVVAGPSGAPVALQTWDETQSSALASGGTASE